jgi:dTDP-4-dehydrorhamnose reductase
MRIFVIGAGGMLGSALVPHFKSKGHDVMATDIDVNEHWLSYCDVRDYHGMHYIFSEFKPEAIFNLAAMTDLEECETHAGKAIDTNTTGSANCTALASKLHVPYVYISTAGIFDGKQEYYTDLDIPNPLCVYAKGKYWGELIAQTTPKHIVLRCGWQMGGAKKDKKLIGKLTAQLKAGATELNLVTDKLGTPTYVKDFSRQIDRLLTTQTYGVFNTVCQGEASRYEVAEELVRLLGLQSKIKINKVDSTFWSKEYFAPRPASEKLITVKLDDLGLNVMREWKTALAEYVHENSEFFNV